MKINRDTLAIPNDPTPWLLVQPNENRDFCVLWLQGWKSTIQKHEPIITRLAERTGLSFAILDYAGHGSHSIPLEETTRKQQFDEVLFAYETLRKMDYKRIIVIGTSFGAYLTALLTEKYDPYAVILRAPAIYEDDEFSMDFSERDARNEKYQAFKKTVTFESNLRALTSIRKYQGWTYVIEHELDSVIPANIPHSYFEAAKYGNYLIIPGIDHSPVQMSEPEKHFHHIEVLLGNLLSLILLP